MVFPVAVMKLGSIFALLLPRTEGVQADEFGQPCCHVLRDGRSGPLTHKVGVRQVEQERRAALVRRFVCIKARPRWGDAFDAQKKFPVVVLHADRRGGAFPEKVVGERVGGPDGVATGAAVRFSGAVGLGEGVRDINGGAQGKGARTRARNEKHFVRRGGVLDAT